MSLKHKNYVRNMPSNRPNKDYTVRWANVGDKICWRELFTGKIHTGIVVKVGGKTNRINYYCNHNNFKNYIVFAEDLISVNGKPLFNNNRYKN